MEIPPLVYFGERKEASLINRGKPFKTCNDKIYFMGFLYFYIKNIK